MLDTDIFHRVQLAEARKELNRCARTEWAARQQSKAACARYAAAYERVTGEPYDPCILRTDQGPVGLGHLSDE